MPYAVLGRRRDGRPSGDGRADLGRDRRAHAGDRPGLHLSKQVVGSTYRLKLTAAAARQPQILLLGPSRMLQWRSAMFRPHSFYDAGQAANTQRDFRRFVEDLGYSPAVILFSLEFFTLHLAWDDVFPNQSYADRGGLASAEQATILRKLWPLVREDPALLLRWRREPVYGLRTFGLRAVETGAGTRLDGSFHYGGIIAGWAGTGADSIEEALARVRVGAPPFPPADHLRT